MSITYRAIATLGEEVLLIKWYTDDGEPAIKIMGIVGEALLEAMLGFDDKGARDRAFDTKMPGVAEVLVRHAQAAQPEEGDEKRKTATFQTALIAIAHEIADAFIEHVRANGSKEEADHARGAIYKALQGGKP